VGGLVEASGSNTVWTTNTTAAGSFQIGPNYSTIGSQIDQGGRMSLRGDNADLDINGKSLKNWMERVEERLNILTPNPELEKEWDDLRRLGKRYRALEKKCKEKAQMWEALKKVQPKQP
jgi:flagellar motility protein MotE (MotC chaperone)